MIEKIKTKDLKVGMHVIIPAAWLNHPFAKGSFDIKSKEQIQKIVESGFVEVKIDTSKEVPVAETNQEANDNRVIVTQQEWEPGKLVPPALLEAIHDKKLLPEKRATVVYNSSVELMRKLLDDPKAENIKEAKQGIAEIVDMIFSRGSCPTICSE